MTVEPGWTAPDSARVNEVGVIMRLPFLKHSSLEIAFRPRSIKV